MNAMDIKPILIHTVVPTYLFEHILGMLTRSHAGTDAAKSPPMLTLSIDFAEG